MKKKPTKKRPPRAKPAKSVGPAFDTFVCMRKKCIVHRQWALTPAPRGKP